MRTFEFRLEPLLEMRTRAEDAARRAFLACRAQAGECEARLLQLATPYDRGVTVAELRLRDAYLRPIGELAEALEIARGVLVEATRERRVIETLKQRRRREFDAAEARRDELELDEANARRREHRGRKRVAS